MHRQTTLVCVTSRTTQGQCSFAFKSCCESNPKPYKFNFNFSCPNVGPMFRMIRANVPDDPESAPMFRLSIWTALTSSDRIVEHTLRSSSARCNGDGSATNAYRSRTSSNEVDLSASVQFAHRMLETLHVRFLAACTSRQSYADAVLMHVIALLEGL